MYEIICSHNLNPFEYIKRGNEPAITENQKRLMSAVESSLHKGIFYTTEVYAHVCKEMNDILTPAILAQGSEKQMRNEHFDFGMDIYYARKAVEAMLKLKANNEALSKLQSSGLIAIGTQIKKFSIGEVRSGTLTTTSFGDVDSQEEGMVLFSLTRRGSKKQYNGSIGANDTRLLSSILEAVTDDTVKKKTANHINTYTIDITANRQKEYRCQI